MRGKPSLVESAPNGFVSVISAISVQSEPLCSGCSFFAKKFVSHI